MPTKDLVSVLNSCVDSPNDVGLRQLRTQPHPTVLVVAHGNSLRALCKHLDRISDQNIEHLDLPTGTPLVYELSPDMKPVEHLSTLERTVVGTGCDSAMLRSNL